jgi:hypothetical protein
VVIGGDEQHETVAGSPATLPKDRDHEVDRRLAGRHDLPVRKPPFERRFAARPQVCLGDCLGPFGNRRRPAGMSDAALPWIPRERLAGWMNENQTKIAH